jgi:hypothetical protein
MNADSSPIPNCPRNSVRANPISSRFELRPIVASSSRTSSGRSPIPLSLMLSRCPSTTIPIVPGAAASVARRAVTASTAFCSSSRR